MNAREQIVRVLEEVFEHGAYSNIALKKTLEHSQLSDKDRSFVTEVVYGTVARKITLEWYLSHVIEDRTKLDPWVYYLLMMSLYQLVYLDRIPDHAIVNEAVRIAKSRKEGSEKFVNAILRKLLREGLPAVDTIKRKNKRYSVQYSLPVWLVKELIEEYGEERACAIFKSLYQRNKSSIRVVDLSEKEKLAQELEASASLIASSALVKDQGHFAVHSLFKEGRITIQDESSQLVAPVLDLQGDEWVLDACAAPGGKTTHIASFLTTGKVTALDLYDHKLKLIQENAKRLHVADKILTKKLDATRVFETFGPDAFDKVLVDAPCSGIGLIRRKPDIKYHMTEESLKALEELQRQILSVVWRYVKPGGTLIYSTCTINKGENEKNASWIRGNLPFEPVDIRGKLPEGWEAASSASLQEGQIQILPGIGPWKEFDGFFISVFKRRG